MSDKSAPDIFDYLDLRRFIHDMAQYYKKELRLSDREFAKRAGFGSPSYLKMIVTGDRNLSPASREKLIRLFHLKPKEIDYFKSLQGFQEAATLEEKDLRYQEILKLHRRKSGQALHYDIYRFLSHWHLVALLEGLNSDWGQKSTAEMAWALQISESKLKEGLQILERLQLIRPHGRGWKKIFDITETPDEVTGISIRNYYREMLLKTIESIDTEDAKDRELGSLCLSLTEEDFKELKLRLVELQKEFLDRYENKKSKSFKGVYQIGLQLIPLIRF